MTDKHQRSPVGMDCRASWPPIGDHQNNARINDPVIGPSPPRPSPASPASPASLKKPPNKPNNSATAPTACSWQRRMLNLLQTMVMFLPMIDANGQPLTREQTLQIRRNSSRGLSAEQIGEGVKRNRQARLSTETEQPLPRNTNASSAGLKNKD